MVGRASICGTLLWFCQFDMLFYFTCAILCSCDNIMFFYKLSYLKDKNLGKLVFYKSFMPYFMFILSLI